MAKHLKDIGTAENIIPRCQHGMNPKECVSCGTAGEEPELTPFEEFKLEILKWENDHLAKIDPKTANLEFAQIAGLVREIGERCNRRLQNATQGRCGACEKPLGGRPWNQVSIFNTLLGKYEEKYSCSEKCNVRLIDMQHKAAVATQAAG